MSDRLPPMTSPYVVRMADSSLVGGRRQPMVKLKHRSDQKQRHGPGERDEVAAGQVIDEPWNKRAHRRAELMVHEQLAEYRTDAAPKELGG